VTPRLQAVAAARAALRPAHLYQPAPRRPRPRRPAARRDRRLPGPLPDPGIAGLPGRGRPLHPPVRHDPRRRVPLRLRQTAPRRRHRLRRRLPPRQPLGRPALRRRHRPRQRPPPRRPHPRPRLALHHLALLARRHRLRPRPPQSPPAHPGRAKTSGGLTQGYSCRHLRSTRIMPVAGRPPTRFTQRCLPSSGAAARRRSAGLCALGRPPGAPAPSQPGGRELS
jgi:hypothetical protein